MSECDCNNTCERCLSAVERLLGISKDSEEETTMVKDVAVEKMKIKVSTKKELRTKTL